jgi:hypothetical protein
VFIDRASGQVKQRREASDFYQSVQPRREMVRRDSLRLNRIDVYDAKEYRLVHRLPAPTMPSHRVFA